MSKEPLCSRPTPSVFPADCSRVVSSIFVVGYCNSAVSFFFLFFFFFFCLFFLFCFVVFFVIFSSSFSTELMDRFRASETS